MKSTIEFSGNLFQLIKDFDDVFGVRAMKLMGKIKKINWNPDNNRWACQIGDSKVGNVWVSIFLNEKVPADLRETVQNLKEGDEIEVEAWKAKGKWLNIKNIIPCEQIDKEPVEEEQFPDETVDNEGEQSSWRDVLISRQVAIKAAVELGVAFIQVGEKVGGDFVVEMARLIEDYILRRK